MAALDDSYDHYRDRCPVERDIDAIYEPEEETLHAGQRGLTGGT